MADYGTIADHADPVMALLYAAANLTVYPAEAGGPSTVPADAVPPYVSVHIAAEWPNGQRLDQRSTRTRVRIYTHCVGANGTAARGVLDKVRAALLDVKPTITGRSVFPIRSETTQPPQPYEPSGPTAISIAATWRLETLPGVESS